MSGPLVIEKATIAKDEVCVKMKGCETVSYVFFWLRDNCRCDLCYNTKTNQRRHDILDIPENAQPKVLNAQEDVLSIEWDDGHKSKYEAKFLWECWPNTWRQKSVIQRTLWSGNQIENTVAIVQKDDFMKSNETLKTFLKSLLTYGVAFVDGVEPNLKDTEKVIRRFTPVQETMFGSVWDFTSDMKWADTAYTNIALGTHTDNTYFTEAAGLLVLHCLEHDGTGGESILLDAFKGVEDLKDENPKAYDILTRSLQPAQYIEPGYYHSYTAPVIQVNPVTNQLQQIRYNTYDRTAQCVGTGRESYDYYMALRELAKKFNCEKSQWKFKLKPGRLMFFDNWRVLHGRASFTGKRVFGGCYVGRGDWLSAARVQGLLN